MDKIGACDTVRFIDDTYHRNFRVKYVLGDDCCVLDEIPGYSFSPDILRVIEKSPYKIGDKLDIAGVYWNEDKKKFRIIKVAGEVEFADEGELWIEFEKRVLDHYGFPVLDLGKFRVGEYCGADCDAVFTLSDPESILAAKKIWYAHYGDKVYKMTTALRKMKENYGMIKADVTNCNMSDAGGCRLYLVTDQYDFHTLCSA